MTVKAGAKTPGVSFNRGMVEIRVKEPPREGKANAACQKALARALGVGSSTIQLVRGSQSHSKVFALMALTPAELAVRLARLRR